MRRHGVSQSIDGCLSYVLCKLDGNAAGRSSGLSSFSAANLPVPTLRARRPWRPTVFCSSGPSRQPCREAEAAPTQMKNYSSESVRDFHPSSLPPGPVFCGGSCGGASAPSCNIETNGASLRAVDFTAQNYQKNFIPQNQHNNPFVCRIAELKVIKSWRFNICVFTFFYVVLRCLKEICSGIRPLLLKIILTNNLITPKFFPYHEKVLLFPCCYARRCCGSGS